jgi:hypothetical protein
MQSSAVRLHTFHRHQTINAGIQLVNYMQVELYWPMPLATRSFLNDYLNKVWHTLFLSTARQLFQPN